MLCALGISQLKRINTFKNQRSLIFSRYRNSLAELNEIQLPTQRSYVDPNWHLYPIQVNANFRRQIFESLRNSGIGVQVNYIPANRHPVFADQEIDSDSVKVSSYFYEKQISLPMHVNLSEEEQDYISTTLIKLCRSLKS